MTEDNLSDEITNKIAKSSFASHKWRTTRKTRKVGDWNTNQGNYLELLVVFKVIGNFFEYFELIFENSEKS